MIPVTSPYIDVSTFRSSTDPDFSNARDSAIDYANQYGGTIYFPALTVPYVFSRSCPPITGAGVNIRGEGRGSTLAAAAGVTGISLLSFAIPGFDAYVSHGFIEHLFFNGNPSAKDPSGRANIGLSLQDTVGIKATDLIFANCLTSVLMEDTATPDLNGVNWEERNHFRTIGLQNCTNGFLLQADAGNSSPSFEHSLWDGITFTTGAPGDAVFHLTGGALLGNAKIHVDGNFAAPSGFSALFLLDGGSCITGNIIAMPENNGAGSAYAFYGNSGSNWVTAAGQISGCTLWGGTAWGTGTCVFRGPGAQYLGSLTTTHANVSSGMYYDTFKNPGINPQCRLFVVPTNAIAAQKSQAFIAPSNVTWGYVNVVHNGVPGGTLDIWCE